MLLDVKHVKKYYGKNKNVTRAVDDVSFCVDKGEFVSIMGTSGSGKTTLLNCISTIDTVTEGRILLDGQDMTKLNEKEVAEFRRNNLGFIFQESNLLDTLTVEENIALPLTIRGMKTSEIDARVIEISARLKISDILKKYPYEISGGQKQRGAAARAVVTDPKLVLADEPTGALDSHSAKITMEIMANLNKTLHTTIILVTHDAASASYAERILFLRDGRIYHEVSKKKRSNSAFYQEILKIQSDMGGDCGCC